MMKATLVVPLLFCQCTTMSAMEFRVAHNPEQNIEVIIGEGTIVDGDSARLEAIIPRTGRDEYGNISLYLNSPGGSVPAAFAIVEVMDRYEFSAFVSSNAICASACASIVYISARFHQVVGKGLLGIHTCYSHAATETPEPSSFCNKVIAENASNHGTSYAAVNMWQSAYRPESMAWIDQDVA
jgi:hypothetical protein